MWRAEQQQRWARGLEGGGAGVEGSAGGWEKEEILMKGKCRRYVECES